jgi:hypothetical protein
MQRVATGVRALATSIGAVALEARILDDGLNRKRTDLSVSELRPRYRKRARLAQTSDYPYTRYTIQSSAVLAAASRFPA